MMKKYMKIAFSILSILISSCAEMVFYDGTPSKVFSGIEIVQVNGSKLTLTIVDNGLFEEYKAPAINNRSLTGRIINSWPDTDKKVKTGKSEWKAAQSGHKILVSGFDRIYEFVTPNNYLQKIKEIDLSTPILNTSLPDSTTLKINCVDCNVLAAQEQSMHKNIKSTVETTYDFRTIKESLIKSQNAKLAQEEAIKLEQDKSEKEWKERIDLKEKEDLKAKALKEVNLGEFKTQCKELGFKVGTPDFGNCVLKLNEIK